MSRQAAPATARARRKPSMAARADRHALYEKSVQNAEAEIDFVDATFRKLRKRRALTLREDFCGTANVCCEWVRRGREREAVGVDLDPEVLDWAREHNLPALKPALQSRVRLVQDDVLTARLRPVDALLAMNFSYWLFKTRDGLREYFAAALRNLKSDGVLFLDCYGGHDAFKVLKERRKQRNFTYVWEQASYNPVDGHMTCHIHFQFKDGSKLPRAFSYEWRLWTLPELREILAEAGFERTIVYWQGWNTRTGEPNGEFSPTEVGDPDAGWIAYLAALK